MDEFSQHIEDILKEQEEHPERFTLTWVCSQCGKRWDDWFQKDEVTKYLAKHNGNREVHDHLCVECATKEDSEDED